MREPAAGSPDTQGDGGVKVAAGEVAQGVGAGEYSQTEGKRYTHVAHAHGEPIGGGSGCGKDSGATATKDKPEGAEELGPQAFRHRNVPKRRK